MRAVARTLTPSTRAEVIETRFSVLSTFAILDIMLAFDAKVKKEKDIYLVAILC
ncbi:MAG TPA: hypothetical protein VKU44_01610 [Terriglobia bacterium]|nr:hypothetical protein [Terriglobia bacterium]